MGVWSFRVILYIMIGTFIHRYLWLGLQRTRQVTELHKKMSVSVQTPQLNIEVDFEQAHLRESL